MLICHFTCILNYIGAHSRLLRAVTAALRAPDAQLRCHQSLLRYSHEPCLPELLFHGAATSIRLSAWTRTTEEG